MVFEYGMGDATLSRTMRADDYALSEETKRLRDASQARLTDGAYESALALLLEHRPLLDRLAGQLLLKETLDRHELADLLAEREEPLEQALALGVLRSLPRRD
jgi:cell division protease FtsH